MGLLRRNPSQRLALVFSVLLAYSASACLSMDSADSEFLRAMKLKDQGKPSEALDVLKRFLATKDSHDCTVEILRALEALGDLYVDLGSKDSAALAYKNAVQRVEAITYEDEKRKFVLGGIRKKLKELKREQDVAKLGEDEVLFREAENLRKGGSFLKAEGAYRKIMAAFQTGNYFAPSRHWVGECLLRSGKAPEAEQHWQAIVKSTQPHAPWRGHTLLGLGDLCLEYHFELQGAQRYYDQALKESQDAADSSWKEIAPDLHERRGLCEYVQGKFDAANEWFVKGAFLRPEPEKKAGGWPTGFENLAKACKNKTLTTPRQMLDRGSAKVKLLLALGDAYALGYNHDKAQLLFVKAQILTTSESTPEQTAYAIYREGCQWYQLYGCDKDEGLLKAIELFKTCYARFPKTEWAPQALLMHAVLTMNNLRNEIVMKDPQKARAYEEETLQLYEKLEKLYPASPQAARVAYYRCFWYYWREDWKTTVAECASFLARYGNSEWADHIREVQRYVVYKASEGAVGSGNRGGR